jgi:hypothetical protein
MWKPALRCLRRPKHLTAVSQRFEQIHGLVARIARTLTSRCRELTVQITELDRELEPLITRLAPSLPAPRGCGPLTAAKIVCETAESSGSDPGMR